MNKKSKIISGLGAVSTLAAATDFFFCKTLFNQTLNRKKIKTKEQIENPEQHMDDTQTMNRRREYLRYKRWIETNEVSKLSLKNRNGLNLIANIYPNKDESHKWVILVHGYLGKKEDMKLHARRFHMEGFHVVAPDLRAHGESDGDYITMGWSDRLDIKEWIESILRVDNQAQIVLYGISMGASAVMMCASEKLPNNVKCVIEDSGFTSVHDIFSHLLLHVYKMPAFPIIDSAGVLIKQRLGFSIKKASALKQIEKTTLPVMFIHGDHNTIVPTDMVFDLYETCPTDKELYIINDCGHNITMYSEPEVYFKNVFNFINQHIDD